MARSIVIGVKINRSILFFEMAFPNVFNRNKPVISHKAYVIIFFGILIIQKSAWAKITIMKSAFNKIEKISKRYISLFDFNLPPQIRWYGIIFSRIMKCNNRNKVSRIKSPNCAVLIIFRKWLIAVKFTNSSNWIPKGVW